MRKFEKVTIVGTGPMAEDYCKVLKALNVPFEAIGNSQATADKFKTITGQPAYVGGYKKWLGEQTTVKNPVIIALTEDYLGQAADAFLAKGAKQILIEKPGAAKYDELLQLEKKAQTADAKVFIGYNRRFYSSVLECKKRVEEDGGVDSFFFEFTEWGHVIEKKVCTKMLKEEWYWHNSTHVVDLAFFLGGFPEKVQSMKAGSLEWHPSASKYVGCGKTAGGALFSYMANWAAPGRWGVEILTKKNRYILRPLEKLQVQKLGTVAIEEIAIDNADDVNFKPGLKKQVESFLGMTTTKTDGSLVGIEQQARNLNWFRKVEEGTV